MLSIAKPRHVHAIFTTHPPPPVLPMLIWMQNLSPNKDIASSGTMKLRVSRHCMVYGILGQERSLFLETVLNRYACPRFTCPLYCRRKCLRSGSTRSLPICISCNRQQKMLQKAGKEIVNRLKKVYLRTIRIRCITQAAMIMLSPGVIIRSMDTSSFARSATSPSFAYVSNPASDSSLCRAAAPRLRPLQLLLPDCIDPLSDCC